MSLPHKGRLRRDVSLCRIPRPPVETPEDSDLVPALKGLQDEER